MRIRLTVLPYGRVSVQNVPNFKKTGTNNKVLHLYEDRENIKFGHSLLRRTRVEGRLDLFPQRYL